MLWVQGARTSRRLTTSLTTAIYLPMQHNQPTVGTVIQGTLHPLVCAGVRHSKSLGLPNYPHLSAHAAQPPTCWHCHPGYAPSTALCWCQTFEETTDYPRGTTTHLLALSSRVRSIHWLAAVLRGSWTRAIRCRARAQHRSERIGFLL